MRVDYIFEGVGEIHLERAVNPCVYNVMYFLVEEEYRNLGIGTAMMKAVCRDADYHRVEIWLSPTPEPGRMEDLKRFYRRLGFMGHGYMIRQPKSP